jgi:hypothetical protein
MIGKLLLLLLVGLGIGLALPSTRGRITGPVIARVYQEMTPRRLEMIATRLDQERGTGQALPDNDGLETWILRNTTLSARDPWGNRYYIERRGDGFVIGSNGPDGTRGNEDDITAARRVMLR